MWRDFNGLTKALFILIVIGAINWGLIGFFNWNLVDAIFRGGAREETSGLARFIYALVGLAGIGTLALLLRPRGEARGVGRPVTS
jgi:uncharacterized membrane protein YuzA (DUF378 family)